MSPPTPLIPSATPLKYAAFVSYRHVPFDRRWAMWLHRSLETWRTPNRLVREKAIQPRLGRVFRDEDELAAAPDLSAAIREALEASGFLYVVCSRETPKSPWINKEVEYFRSIGRAGSIRALLIDGEPHEAFPSALYDLAEGHGHPPSEPLAADVRPRSGEPRSTTRRRALLQLIAPLLECRLDDLRQRDAERSIRRLRWVVTATTAALALVVALAAAALVQRDAARRTLAAGHAEQARLEWLGGHPRRALPYLVASLELSSGNSALRGAQAMLSRFLTASAGPLATIDEVAVRRLLTLSLRSTVPLYEMSEGADNLVGLAATPDGMRFITTQWDGRVRLWERRQGRPALVKRLTESGEFVQVRMTADGSRVALFARRLGMAGLWDVRTASLIRQFRGIDPSARYFDLDAPGMHLLAASDRRAWIWSLQDGVPVGWEPHRASGAPIAILSAAFTPDGQHVLTTGPDGAARLWTVPPQEKPLVSFDVADSFSVPRLPRLDVNGAVESRDGRLVATVAGQTRVDLWNASSGAHASTPVLSDPSSPLGSVVSINFSPDSKILLSHFNDGSFRTWDVAAGRPGAVVPSEGAAGIPIAVFDAAGQRLLTSWRDSTVIWSTRDPQRFARLGHTESWARDAVFPAGTDEVLTVEADAVRGWPARGLLPIPLGARDPRHAHAARVTAVAFSGDGSRIVSGSEDGVVKVWDAANGSLINSVCNFPERNIRAVAMNGDGTRVIATTHDGSLCHREVSSVGDLGVPQEDGRPVSLESARYGADGRTLLLTGRDGLLRTWDGSKRAPQPLFTDEVLPCHMESAVSANGRRALTVDRDKQAKIWDVPSGHVVATLSEPLDVRWTCATFSPDGRWLLVTPQRNEPPIVWSSATGRREGALKPDRISLPGSQGDANGWIVSFSPDGSIIVTAFDGQDVILWDRATRRPRAFLIGESGVRDVAFSPQGDVLLTVGAGGAKLWDPRTGALLDVLQAGSARTVTARFDADGNRILVAGDGFPLLWDLSPERRSPEELGPIVDCYVPWRLENGTLIGRTDRPSGCATE